MNEKNSVGSYNVVEIEKYIRVEKVDVEEVFEKS